jgi:hypothetical protein
MLPRESIIRLCSLAKIICVSYDDCVAFFGHPEQAGIQTLHFTYFVHLLNVFKDSGTEIKYLRPGVCNVSYSFSYFPTCNKIYYHADESPPLLFQVPDKMSVGPALLYRLEAEISCSIVECIWDTMTKEDSQTLNTSREARITPRLSML